MTDHTPDPDATIAERLAAVRRDVGAVGKNDQNTHQRYSFRGIDAVVNAVVPAMNRHGVIVTPRLQTIDYVDVTVGERRSQMTAARVVVEYTFAAIDNDDTLAVVVPGEAFDSGDKATPKAMSVAFRTALLQALTLPTDEPDPDSHSYERSSEPSYTPATPEQVDRINNLLGSFTGDELDRVRAAWKAEIGGGRFDQIPTELAAKGIDLLRRLQAELGQADDRKVTPDQLRKIHALVGELPGDYERQERLDMFAEFIGRPLDTSNDLSLAEASTVIDRLQELAELGR